MPILGKVAGCVSKAFRAGHGDWPAVHHAFKGYSSLTQQGRGKIPCGSLAFGACIAGIRRVKRSVLLQSN